MKRAEAPPRRALVVDADDALYGLVAEWLAPLGFDVAREGAGRHDLILVDLPFPRQGRPGRLEALQLEHPATPIIALSSTFLPGIDSSGAVARELGVAGVLAKPVTRDVLLAAVDRALGTPA